MSRDESTVDGASILTIDTATYYSEVNHLTISVVAENTLGAEETGAQLTVEPKKVSGWHGIDRIGHGGVQSRVSMFCS